MTEQQPGSVFLNQGEVASVDEAIAIDSAIATQNSANAKDKATHEQEVAEQNAEAAQSQPLEEDAKPDLGFSESVGQSGAPYIVEEVDCSSLYSGGKTPSDNQLVDFVCAGKIKAIEKEKADAKAYLDEKKKSEIPQIGSPLDHNKFEKLSEETPKATFCGYCTTHGHAVYSYEGKDYKREDIPKGVSIEPIIRP